MTRTAAAVRRGPWLVGGFWLALVLAASAAVGSADDQDASEQSATAAEAPAEGFSKTLDRAAGKANKVMSAVFFYDVYGIPLVVLWLAIASVWFTWQMGFINFRGFKHAVLVTMGRYDEPGHEGEVSHFQALSAALSGTLGLGNIAGVALAIAAGGPGATFWMIFAGLVGMSAKFTECTLGQKYRRFRPDGLVMGGAMYYLSDGLARRGLGPLGKGLAVFFCVMCIGGSLGGGNAFQVNQALNGIRESIPYFDEDRAWIFGLVMSTLVGLVILGGIKRIGATAEKIVPFMCAIYIAACLYVLFARSAELPAAVARIFVDAFTPKAAIVGGAVGVFVVGFKRAAFSNEAGIGSAAIAHSAARTSFPVREGIVALLEPFIDTVVVCTMTALVIVVSGAHENPAYAGLIQSEAGSALTSRALSETLPWFKWVLGVCVFLFAYATLVSWYYYGERCWCYLFGDRSSIAFKLLFLTFTFLGAIVSAGNVLDFGDLMILGMAFPNIFGVALLSREVKRDLDDYWTRYRNGEFEVKR